MKFTSKTISFNVDTVDDLPTVDQEDGQVVIVKEKGRGGTFIYDSTRLLENDGGTVFNGWVRQYEGYAKSSWFGIKSSISTDQTVKMQLALDSGLNIELNNYKVKVTEITINSNFRASEIFTKSIYVSGGVTIASSNLLIENIKFSANYGSIDKAFGIVTVNDKISDVTFRYCYFGDNINTATSGGLSDEGYSFETTDFKGSYGLHISETGCSNIVIDNCVFKNMHKTSAKDAIATDGFTGGLLLYSPIVTSPDIATTITIMNSQFVNMSSPDVTDASNSDADAIRQYTNTTNDAGRYGSMNISGCVFRDIVKSGIKIASFSNVVISDCKFYSKKDSIASMAPIRLQYSLNSSISDISMYGTWQYGIILNGSNVSVDGVRHSNSEATFSQGGQSFSAGDGRITNTLLLFQTAIAGDYITVSNVSSINVKQIMNMTGSLSLTRPMIGNLTLNNIECTLNQNGSTSGDTTYMRITSCDTVNINNISILHAVDDSTGHYIIDTDKDGIVTSGVNELHISNSSFVTTKKAIVFGSNTSSWFRKQSLIVHNSSFEVSKDDFVGSHRLIESDLRNSTEAGEIYSITGCTFRIPMSTVDGYSIGQPLGYDYANIHNVCVHYTSVQTKYVRLFSCFGATKWDVNSLKVYAISDIGIDTVNTAVYMFDTGSDSMFTGISSENQVSIAINNGVNNTVISNIKSNKKAIHYASTVHISTTVDSGTVVTAGVREEYFQRSNNATGVTPDNIPRFIGDACFHNIDSVFYEAVGLTTSDWRLRN